MARGGVPYFLFSAVKAGITLITSEERPVPCSQWVTKRCRLSLLTNSALVISVQMRGEEGSCGVSANEYNCAHHVT